MKPVQEKFTKVPKLNQEQQKLVDLKVNTMLEKDSIHKFEESELVHSIQTLQDGRFPLSEICVAKEGLYM